MNTFESSRRKVSNKNDKRNASINFDQVEFYFKSTIIFNFFVILLLYYLNNLWGKSRLRGYFVCSKPSVQRSGALKSVSYEKYEVTKNNHFFKTWFWLTFLGMTCTVIVINYRNNFQNSDQQVEFAYTYKNIFFYLLYVFLSVFYLSNS